RRQISESHARAKLRSRPRVLPAHDRLHVVSDRVETRDRLPRGIADLRVLVGAQAEAGAHRRGFDLYRIQRPVHNTEAGIRPVRGIAVGTVVGVAAFAEVIVDTRTGELVMPTHG